MHSILLFVILFINVAVFLLLFFLFKKSSASSDELLIQKTSDILKELLQLAYEKNTQLLNDNMNKIIQTQNEINIKNSDRLIEFFSRITDSLNEQKVSTMDNQSKFAIQIETQLKEIIKTNSEQNLRMINSLNEFQSKLEESYNSFKKEMLESNQINLEKLSSGMQIKLEEISEKVDSRLKEIVKINNEQNLNMLTSLNQLKSKIEESYQNFKKEINETNQSNFEKLTINIERKLDLISGKVDERLNEGFRKTNETFVKITERLVKIDEAQKKIEALSTNVNSLQNVLTDKKTRGIFGEVQLNQILKNIFGEKNDQLYSIQKKIDDSIADAVIYLPEPHGMMAIDSKFPLESYTRMFDETITIEERDAARKEFKRNVRKHIDDISSKYIVKNSTADVAVMFLPAEAIFAEINAYHPDVMEYAVTRNIWVCSPTTLVAVLTTIQAVIRNIETGKQAKVIQEHLAILAKEFERYYTRWNSISRHIDQVSKDVRDINVTSEKISRNFNKIQKVEFTSVTLADPDNIVWEDSATDEEN
ncbi:MAG: DNA recombination protein RmuC [Candidatus Cloacimonetes bacterium]|nr:DNA recombination protein RmuC [Candidatus Cloacimonadota bacterium]